MKKLKKLLLLALWGIMGSLAMAQPAAYQLPAKVTGLKAPVQSLNGQWNFKFDRSSAWENIQVPGEAVMQGYGIQHDNSFFYSRKFLVPSQYKGKKTIIRFDGVYSFAKLSINGKAVTSHHGGFTRWEVDITPFVIFGKQNEIELEVQDQLDDISYASGYAHHPIGGILRDVTLFATAAHPVTDFNLETAFDASYTDAQLKLDFGGFVAKGATIKYTLTDPNGKSIVLDNPEKPIVAGANSHVFRVAAPLKWDAEHPNLYRLDVEVKEQGSSTYAFHKSVGFREVKVVKDQLMVNGKPVKLRGANRHDMHPTLGRSASAYYDSLDVQLFKEANINFIRTSHYPPTERFVEYCNKYGIYVEVETAICFVDTYRQKNYAPGASQNDPKKTDQYLSQSLEMVNTFKSHPAVLFWSIGNESIYGDNFKRSHDLVKQMDPTRPIIWSYPGSQTTEPKIYEILSMHYQDVYGNLTQYGKTTRNFEGHGIPALFDEWAHPACYTYKTLQDDPNIREFWGISMDMMWSGLFPKQGGLGGAIWGYVDEVFMIPQQLKKGTAFWKEFAHTAKPEDFQGQAVGYGEWGIVDVWRRKKPEFWSTKKAQSPVLVTLKGKIIPDFASFQPLTIPVYNRFDHTSLQEIKLQYTYAGKTYTLGLPDIAPHQKGYIQLPGLAWQQGEQLALHFVDSNGMLLDSYRYFLGEHQVKMPESTQNGGLQLVEESNRYLIRGRNFTFPISKTTGLIENALIDGKVLIQKGPFLNMDINLNHLTGAEVRKSASKYLLDDKNWQLNKLDVRIKDNLALVSIMGKNGSLSIQFDLTIDGKGEMKTLYHTQGEPNGYLREIGLKYYLSNALDRITWSRNGYWNDYPQESFAGNEGTASLSSMDKTLYGQEPTQPWYMDTHNYYYWADKGARSQHPLTQRAKGMKENIYYYALGSGAKNLMQVVSPQADNACRMDRLENEQLVLYINNKWDYPEIAWGNYCKTLEASPCQGSITLKF
ncbi:glycoside hydrolase family 2 TIM barrel-domain containing protein [Sphingobacterium sp. Lzh-3]|uniref:glycoside hydrolase family 2 protein n=1 Tax=Sphingobacterium sp. Lzh-3 TaxID=3382150 RepID=UPI00398C868C